MKRCDGRSVASKTENTMVTLSLHSSSDIKLQYLEADTHIKVSLKYTVKS